MYEQFYGLREKPFNMTPDPEFLFFTEKHKEAFAHLVYGIRERRGFIEITGEVGAGKTTLCRALINEFDEDTKIALVLNPFVTEIELIRSINEELFIDADGETKKELLDTLNEYLIDQHSRGRNVVVVIDEAQNLPIETLEQIRLISNLETVKAKLLQIVLVGQPELREKLSRPELRQLNQRITVRNHISSLSRAEVESYIYHRLTVAGSDGDIVFSTEALDQIHEFSQGLPRAINIVCDHALLTGYVQETFTIDDEIVRKVINEIRGPEIPRKKKERAAGGTPFWKAGLAGALGTLIVVGLAYGAWVFYNGGIGANNSDRITFRMGETDHSAKGVDNQKPDLEGNSTVDIGRTNNSRVETGSDARVASLDAQDDQVDTTDHTENPFGGEKAGITPLLQEDESPAKVATDVPKTTATESPQEAVEPTETTDMNDAPEAQGAPEPKQVEPSAGESVTLAKVTQPDSSVEDTLDSDTSVTVDDQPQASPVPVQPAAKTESVPEVNWKEGRFDENGVLRTGTADGTFDAALLKCMNLWGLPAGQAEEIFSALDHRSAAMLGHADLVKSRQGLLNQCKMAVVPTNQNLAMLRLLDLPCILETYGDDLYTPEFVTLEGFAENGNLVIAHPAKGRVLLSPDKLSEAWYGRCMYPVPQVAITDGIVGEGSSSEDIRKIQYKLKRMGYFEGEISGLYDQGTRKAIMELQRDRRIRIDGLVGPETNLSLFASVAGPNTPRLSLFTVREKSRLGEPDLPPPTVAVSREGEPVADAESVQ